jgi:hypothetical protein
MRKFSKKQIVIGGAAAIALAVGGGAAYAYWTNSGSGDGSATTGNTTSFTVTVDNVTLADLTPGGPADTVPFHIQNTESGAEFATTAVATVTGTHDGSGPVTGCTAADFTVDGNTFPAAGDTVAAGATNDYTFDVTMNDTGINQDACKGVTVDLHVAVS